MPALSSAWTAAAVCGGQTWAAGVTAGGARCDDPGGGAFRGGGSLELGDGAKDVEDQPAAGGRGVDDFCRRDRILGHRTGCIGAGRNYSVHYVSVLVARGTPSDLTRATSAAYLDYMGARWISSLLWVGTIWVP